MSCLRLGIDEAGRGCVLGPMVLGACLIDEQQVDHLRTLGVRDSKRLSAKRRIELRAQLEELVVSWKTSSVSARQIDHHSINSLGRDVTLALIKELRPDQVVIDAPVPPAGLPAYRQAIRQRLELSGLGHIEVIAENKADDNHPSCAAASIFAKTTRDQLLHELAEARGVNLGSGYPSDPRTQTFLREEWRQHGSFPPWVRTKWETVRRIVAESAQGQLF
ncbi:MAG: ribonuclease HII [Rickettsiales bacterium]|nr:ribonuclease HII [Rickettsiales bacterium]